MFHEINRQYQDNTWNLLFHQLIHPHYIIPIFTTFDGDFRLLIDLRSCESTPTQIHLHTGTTQYLIEIPHVYFSSCSNIQLNAMS